MRKGWQVAGLSRHPPGDIPGLQAIAAERTGFTWSVHRPHTIVGFAPGNAMNMGSTLAAYASLFREYGERRACE